MKIKAPPQSPKRAFAVLLAAAGAFALQPSAKSQTTLVATESTGWEYYVPIGNEPANDGQGDEWTSHNYNQTAADWTTPTTDNGAPYHFGSLVRRALWDESPAEQDNLLRPEDFHGCDTGGYRLTQHRFSQR